MSLKVSGLTLYDVPVSNHGARIRMLIYAKDLTDVSVQDPSILGGMKSKEYLQLNPLGNDLYSNISSNNVNVHYCTI